MAEKTNVPEMIKWKKASGAIVATNAEAATIAAAEAAGWKRSTKPTVKK